MNSISHSATAAPVFINCIFSGNHSPNGSAFQSFVTGTGKAAPEFYQCAMSGNTGNAIQVTDIGSQFSTLKIRNSIIYNNGFGTGVSVNGAVADATHSIIPFGFPGEGNIGLDPLFVLAPPIDSAHQEGDLHLQDTSPAINAGKNEEVPAGTATDLDGNTRMVDPLTGLPGTVDIGPYEVQSITTSLDGILSEHDWDIFPNPASSKVTIRISKSADDAELKIFDVSGNLKHTLEFPSNEAEKSINLAAFPPGNYFFNLNLGGVQNVKKMVIQQ